MGWYSTSLESSWCMMVSAREPKPPSPPPRAPRPSSSAPSLVAAHASVSMCGYHDCSDNCTGHACNRAHNQWHPTRICACKAAEGADDQAASKQAQAPSVCPHTLPRSASRRLPRRREAEGYQKQQRGCSGADAMARPNQPCCYELFVCVRSQCRVHCGTDPQHLRHNRYNSGCVAH